MQPKTKQLNRQETCVIDNRISSTIQATGGGLDDQEAICLNLAQNRNLKILKVFSKIYSGRLEERADFEEILEYIKEQQRKEIVIDYYVFKSIDRFTRDGAVTFEEMKDRLELLGVQPIDAYGIIQPKKNTLEHLGFEYKWSMRSPTATAQLVEAQRAKDEVTDILTRMIGAEIRLVKEGYKVRAPHDGYRNKTIYVNGQEKTIEEPDPERANFYIQMFELRARGMSDPEIVKTINAQGFLSKPRKHWSYAGGRKIKVGESNGIPLTVKQLQRIVDRPIYAGINIEKWTGGKPIKQKYDGLVSIDVFNQANRGKFFIKEKEDGSYEILKNYKDPRAIMKRNKFNPLYQFDKLVNCPLGCNKATLSSKNKGKSGERYPAYHCNRNHYWRVPKGEFEKIIFNFLKDVKFDEEFINGFELLLLDKYREREAEILKISSKVSESIGNLKAKQAKAIQDYRDTTSSIIRHKIEEEIEELEERIKSARVERQKVELQETDIKSFIKYVKFIMEHPSEILADNTNPYKQKALWGLFFEETPTYTEIVNGTPKLSPIVRLSSKTEGNKTQLVTLQRIEL